MILYHGTGRCFSEFNPMSFFTEDYGIACSFARMKAIDHDYTSGTDRRMRVIQVRIDLGEVLELNRHDIERFLGVTNLISVDWDEVDRAIFSLLRYHDADTARIYGLEDVGYNETQTMEYPQYVVRDPERITFLNETINDGELST